MYFISGITTNKQKMELFYYFVGFGVLSPRSYIAMLISVLNQARLKLEILLPSPYNKSSAISTALSSVTINSPCYLCHIKYKWPHYLVFGASNLEISQNPQMYFLQSLTSDTADVSINLEVYKKVGHIDNFVEMEKLRETFYSMFVVKMTFSVILAKCFCWDQQKSLKKSQMNYDNRYKVFGNHLSCNGFS